MRAPSTPWSRRPSSPMPTAWASRATRLSGRRRWTSCCPNPGRRGAGQRQWNLQMLVGLIDAGLDVQAATELPRWSIWPGTDPANLPNPYRLEVETRMADETRAGLAALGHRIRPMGGWGAGGAA